MALLPPAFANPRQPFYIDGQEIVRVTSGVLDIQSATNDGSFMSLSPIIFTPPRATIQKYNVLALPDNSFGISRTDMPNVPVRNSMIMQTFPSADADHENTIILNGDVYAQGGDVFIQRDVKAGGRVSGKAGLQYNISYMGNAPPFPLLVDYEGVTIYIQGETMGNSTIDIILPNDFFEAAALTSYQGVTIFRLVSTNSTTQTVRLIDNRGPGQAILLSVSATTVCIIEAVRLEEQIDTYTYPIFDYRSTPIVLTAEESTKSKPTLKKLE